MSLATRCPACQTVFRVVEDQLRVSEGWVRCGRCNEVFNAIEHLVGQAAAAPPEVEHAPAVVRVAPAWPPPAPADDHLDSGMPPPDAGPRPPGFGAQAQGDEHPFGTVHPSVAPPEAGLAADAPPAEPLHDGERGSAAAARPPGTASADDRPLSATFRPAAADPAAGAPSPLQPSFLQAAERAARWHRPGVRLALVGAAVSLVALLGLQIAIEYRDLVAARWVATRPALEALCRIGGCRIEPPRWIDALAVDSSGLVRIEGSPTYRLSVVLRNRSAMAVAPPAIDLTLTDAQGRVIARRSLSAADLGSDAVAVPAGTELALAATLAIADVAVAGYTIELFYP